MSGKSSPLQPQIQSVLYCAQLRKHCSSTFRRGRKKEVRIMMKNLNRQNVSDLMAGLLACLIMMLGVVLGVLVG